MRDIIVNSESRRLVLATDERELDIYDTMTIRRSDGALALTRSENDIPALPLGILEPEPLDVIDRDMMVSYARFSGWSLARISSLMLLIVD